MPKEINQLAYLAGIFDGEGYLGFHPKNSKQKVRVSIGNTYKPLIDWLSTLGGKIGIPRISKLGKKQTFSWRITGYSNVLIFLTDLEPYLLIKKDKANQVMTFLESRLKSRYNWRIANEETT